MIDTDKYIKLTVGWDRFTKIEAIASDNSITVGKTFKEP